MSLLSAVLLPLLEREIVALEPAAAQFLLGQLKAVGAEVVEWAESKLHVDLNGDGVIGENDASN